MRAKDRAAEMDGGPAGKEGVGSDEQLEARGRAVASGDGKRGTGRGQGASAGVMGVRGGSVEAGDRRGEGRCGVDNGDVEMRCA